MFGELEKGQVIGRCLSYLSERGLRVEQISDFDRVLEIAEDARKTYLTPLVSPSSNDLTQGNCLWLVAWRGDEPVMLGGARLEDLGAETVETFWPRSLSRLYGRPKGDLISSVSEDVSGVLRGRLVYFGDLHVSPGFRRSLACVRAFVTVGHMAVSLKWDPAFIYAFVREKDALRGAAVRYGFLDVYPAPMRWLDPPSPRSNSEWCCIVSRGKLASMARASVGALPSPLIADAQASREEYDSISCSPVLSETHSSTRM